jgi:hypothetical protein
MMTTAPPRPLSSCPLKAAVPVRSPRTLLTLAELARQRGRGCEDRACRAAWVASCDGRPFESVRTRTLRGVVFSGAAPLVYALPLPQA